VPRSYFYERNVKPEAHVAANAHLYHGELPAGTRLYDMSADPHRLLESHFVQTAHGQIHKTPDLDQVEKKLKRLGYHGYHSYGPPGAIAYFHDLPVISGEARKAEEMAKAKLPLPESKPTHKQIKYPVGAQKDPGPGSGREAGQLKVQDPETGKTKWRSVRSGIVMAPDGSPTSSRNPSGGK
jgi:hypothetical protein